MGEIHATMNISVDGCCDHTQVIADDEFHEQVSDLFQSYKALLFGRKTYELLHAYWPGVAKSGDGTPGMVRLANILNDQIKYVVSSRNPAPGWRAQQTEPTADAIETLRDNVDGKILLVASPTLARTLIEWGLIEEYYIAVSPMVAGRGPYFLEGVSADVVPSLRDVSRLRSGVLFLHYGFDV